MEIYLFSHSRPKPKERPVWSGHAFTSTKTRQATKKLERELEQAIVGHSWNTVDKAVFLHCVFFFHKTKELKKIDGLIPRVCIPDLDNLIKLTKDSMNKIVFKDDAQVVAEVSEKYYADIEGTYLYCAIIDKDFNLVKTLNKSWEYLKEIINASRNES